MGIYNLQKLWTIFGKSETTRAVLLHDVATNLETTVIDVLHVLYALTGYDTSSKSCSKYAALNQLNVVLLVGDIC